METEVKCGNFSKQNQYEHVGQNFLTAYKLSPPNPIARVLLSQKMIHYKRVPLTSIVHVDTLGNHSDDFKSNIFW